MNKSIFKTLMTIVYIISGIAAVISIILFGFCMCNIGPRIFSTYMMLSISLMFAALIAALIILAIYTVMDW